MSFCITPFDFVFNAIEGELAPEKFKELSLNVFWKIRLEIKEVQVWLTIYDFANTRWEGAETGGN